MNIDFRKYFDISQFTPEQQQLIINSITEVILVRMAATISEHLTEQEINELDHLSQSKDPNAVINWLNQHIPNFSQGVEELLDQERKTIAMAIEHVTFELDRPPQYGNASI